MGVTRGPFSSAVPRAKDWTSHDVSSSSQTEDDVFAEYSIPGLTQCKSNPKLLRSGQQQHCGRAICAAGGVIALMALVASGSGQQGGSSTLRMSPPQQVDVQEERIIDVPLVKKRPSPPVSAAERVVEAVANGRPKCAGPGPCALGGLLECPMLVEVATNNLMQVGAKLLSEQDRELAKGIVVDSFRNFSSQLWIFAPQVASMISSIEISEAERDAILAWMALLRDPRVRGIGLDVAGVIRSSPTPEREYLRKRVEEAMIPRLREMAQLRNELLPRLLPGASGLEGQWQLTLDKDNVRSLNSVSGEFIFDFEPPTSRSATLEEKYFALFGGAFEQGRALLDLFELYVRATSPDLPMPEVQRSLTLGAEPMGWPCQLSSERDTSVDFMKSLLCPLKLAVGGIDALRAVDSVLSASAARDSEKARMEHEMFEKQKEAREQEEQAMEASKSARGASQQVGKSRIEAMVQRENALKELSPWEDDEGDMAIVSKSRALPKGDEPEKESSARLVQRGTESNCSDGSGPCLLRGLMANQRVRETAARNLMQVAGDRLLPADWDMASRVVSAAFDNITVGLKSFAPAVVDEMGQIQLSAGERDSVLRVLELLGDLRVQRLGVEVAEAIRESNSLEKSHLMARIIDKLQSRHEELDALRVELIPEPLSSYAEEGHHWGLTLDEDNIKSMLPVDEETKAALESLRAPLQKSLSEEKKFFSMYSGALEEGRFLLDILQRCVRAMGPHWTVQIGKTMVFGEATLSWPCDPSDLDSTVVDFTKALLCPVKFGAQGLDALLATARQPATTQAPPGGKATTEQGEEDQTQPTNPARRSLAKLLSLRSVQEVAVEILLAAGGQHFTAEDSELALQVIQASFSNISQQLEVRAPALASKLDAFELTEDYEKGLLSHLKLLVDSRVQVVGIEVSGAIRDCGSPDRKYLKHCVEEFLRERTERSPELPDLHVLHNKLIGEPLRSSCVTGEHWGAALDEENVRLLQEYPKNASVTAHPAMQAGEKMNLEQKYFALFAGALVEARLLLDTMQKCNVFGNYHWSPTPDESGVRFGSAELTRPCGLEDLQTVTAEPARVLLCPLKLGALGLDALTAPLPGPAPPLS